MSDWIDKLDIFLKANDQEILNDAGKITMEIAQKLAEEQYETFHRNILKKEAKDEDSVDCLTTKVRSMERTE
jgi:hypothetical protein